MKSKIGMPLVGLGALALAMALPGVAMAQTSGTTYQASLQPVPLNGASGASGHLTLTLNGDQATGTRPCPGSRPRSRPTPPPSRR